MCGSEAIGSSLFIHNRLPPFRIGLAAEDQFVPAGYPAPLPLI